MISPLAKAQGRSRVRWVLFAFIVFLMTENLTVAIYVAVYEMLALILNWQQGFERFWLTPFVYPLALVSGLIGVDIVRRDLLKKTLDKSGEPPPPPDFS